MVDVRPVLVLVGTLLVVLAAAMAPPLLVDLIRGQGAEARMFGVAAGISLVAGLALRLGMRGLAPRWTVRRIFLAVALGWCVPVPFAALPFVLGPAALPWVDALFEAAACLTGTGASVLRDIEHLPAGLLLWRGVLNWLGGLGAIGLGVAVLPVLAVGGAQIYRLDLLGTAEQAGSRLGRIAALVAGAYVLLTLTLAFGLWQAGMGGLESWVHALGAVSSGGASTTDASAGHFTNPTIHLLLLLGMLAGGLPYLLVVRLARGELAAVAEDGQLRWYLGLVGLGTVAVGAWLLASQGLGLGEALRHGAFTVVAVTTGSGYLTLPQGGWGAMPAAILFVLTFVGGCTGSAAGGVKVFRVRFLFADALRQLRRLVRPHAVDVATFDGHAIAPEVPGSVMGFLFVWALAFAVVSAALAFQGLDFVGAIGAAAAALANGGPILGSGVGAAGGHAALPDGAKGLLTAAMLFGRVEMLAMLVLFVPAFWKP